MFTLQSPPKVAQNRTRFEILAKIVSVASYGALKTHIMYKANLSHRQLEKYLSFLEDRGLIIQGVDEETGSRMYRITDKGSEFLREYTRLSEYVGKSRQ